LKKNMTNKRYFIYYKKEFNSINENLNVSIRIFNKKSLQKYFVLYTLYANSCFLIYSIVKSAHGSKSSSSFILNILVKKIILSH